MRQKQPKCSSADEGIKKIWCVCVCVCVCVYEYYSAVKRNHIMPWMQHGWTWR